MNGFLVIARGGMDDLPYGLFATEEDALLAVKTFDKKDVDPIRKLWPKIEVNEFIDVGVLEYKDGRPVRYISPDA